MNYQNKQEWYDKERRHKLVLAIIEKADKQDRELIPAYNRFIETGDEDMFKLFNDFLTLMDTRQRADEMEKENERLQKCIEHYKHEKELYENEKARYMEYYKSKMKEREELCSKIDSMPDEEITCYVGHIRDFISKAIDGKKGWCTKFLYVNVDGEMKYVRGISITDNNKFVLNIGESLPKQPPKPHDELF